MDSDASNLKSKFAYKWKMGYLINHKNVYTSYDNKAVCSPAPLARAAVFAMEIL